MLLNMLYKIKHRGDILHASMCFSFNCYDINVRDHRSVIKNGLSRETGNTGHTRNKTKKNITKTQHNMCLDSAIRSQTQTA